MLVPLVLRSVQMDSETPETNNENYRTEMCQISNHVYGNQNRLLVLKREGYIRIRVYLESGVSTPRGRFP